jgi:hypothetical protein
MRNSPGASCSTGGREGPRPRCFWIRPAPADRGEVHDRARSARQSPAVVGVAGGRRDRGRGHGASITGVGPGASISRASTAPPPPSGVVGAPVGRLAALTGGGRRHRPRGRARWWADARAHQGRGYSRARAGVNARPRPHRPVNARPRPRRPGTCAGSHAPSAPQRQEPRSAPSADVDHRQVPVVRRARSSAKTTPRAVGQRARRPTPRPRRSPPTGSRRLGRRTPDLIGRELAPTACAAGSTRGSTRAPPTARRRRGRPGTLATASGATDLPSHQLVGRGQRRLPDGDELGAGPRPRPRRRPVARAPRLGPRPPRPAPGSTTASSISVAASIVRGGGRRGG